MRVWLWLVYKFTENCQIYRLFSEFIQTQKTYPTSLDKILIVRRWELHAIWILITNIRDIHQRIIPALFFKMCLWSFFGVSFLFILSEIHFNCGTGNCLPYTFGQMRRRWFNQSAWNRSGKYFELRDIFYPYCAVGE